MTAQHWAMDGPASGIETDRGPIGNTAPDAEAPLLCRVVAEQVDPVRHVVVRAHGLAGRDGGEEPGEGHGNGHCRQRPASHERPLQHVPSGDDAAFS